MKCCYLGVDLDARPSVFYSYFHDCFSLIVRSNIQTHVQNIQMARKMEADKMVVFGRD